MVAIMVTGMGNLKVSNDVTGNLLEVVGMARVARYRGKAASLKGTAIAKSGRTGT